MSDDDRHSWCWDLWWLGPVILIVLFAGEPDLMSAIVHRLMECP